MFCHLFVNNKHWYDVCTHIGMTLVAYNECYEMWAHPRTKMLLCVHTYCYDIFLIIALQFEFKKVCIW